VVKVAIGKPLLKQTRHRRAIRRRPQEQGDALDRQPLPVVGQDVVALKSERKVRVVTGLELDVDEPRLCLFNRQHGIGLGDDGGEVDVQDADLVQLAAQEQLSPGSGVTLQELLRGRIERLGHQ
jgi:hypothetical protein